ncbi:putative secreted RxLR effector protein [Phytophthora cinnamomi]|uniref:putative secreted RxLR effector protein n=1 Tax=Phytophthora cinnamomi TaxID=4785 RepID=UPI00355AB732|nr:putative secreted RxLR effector protein [Phytophthora cinnamomi]
MYLLHVLLMALALTLSIGDGLSSAADYKQSGLVKAADGEARSLKADQVAGPERRSLRTANTKLDDVTRRLTSESTVDNGEERTSLARLALAKLQLQYWSWKKVTPNVVYHGFGLHHLSGDALKNSKLRELWEAYGKKWKSRQVIIR